MKTFIVGSAVLFAIGIGIPALAADMPVKAPPLPPAPTWDWTGFYVGTNLGAGYAKDSGDLIHQTVPPLGTFPERFDFSPAGVVGGAQVGVNWQVAPSWVLGLEGDFQGSGQLDRYTCVVSCLNQPGLGQLNFTHIDQNLTWFGTVRERTGWTNGPALFYLTGGLAVGHVVSVINTTEGFGPTVEYGLNDTRAGWVAGGGIEYKLGGPWSVKAEYLYMNLGNFNHSFFYPNPINLPTNYYYSAAIRDNIVRGGLNYKFGATPHDGQVYDVVASAAPIYNWSGVYFGANIGYGVSRDPSTIWNTFGPSSVLPPTGFLLNYEAFLIDPAGVIGGGQVGANWQLGHVVLGVEADMQASNQKDSSTCAQSCDPTPGGTIALIQQKITSFGTARGRLGWAQGNWLGYVTGGWAAADVRTVINQSGDNGIPLMLSQYDFSGWRQGFAIGGGAEAQIVGNLTAKVEYLYLDLNGFIGSFINPPASTPFGTTNVFTTGVRDHIVRAGLNYKFDLGSAVAASH